MKIKFMQSLLKFVIISVTTLVVSITSAFAAGVSILAYGVETKKPAGTPTRWFTSLSKPEHTKLHAKVVSIGTYKREVN